jgi:hypothetical protein
MLDIMSKPINLSKYLELKLIESDYKRLKLESKVGGPIISLEELLYDLDPFSNAGPIIHLMVNLIKDYNQNYLAIYWNKQIEPMDIIFDKHIFSAHFIFKFIKFTGIGYVKDGIDLRDIEEVAKIVDLKASTYLDEWYCYKP